MGHDSLDVVSDRAEAKHDGFGVVAHEGFDRTVFAPGQVAELFHDLARQTRDLASEMGAVVDRARLEIRLVLHPAGQAGIMHVDQRGNELASPLLMRVDPLAAPLAMQLVGNPCQRPFDQPAFAVAFDRVRGLGKQGFQLDQIARREVVLMAREVLLQLKDAALGAEQHCLSHSRTLDPARRIADELAQLAPSKRAEMTSGWSFIRSRQERRGRMAIAALSTASIVSLWFPSGSRPQRSPAM